jgi:hypothetical protein
MFIPWANFPPGVKFPPKGETKDEVNNVLSLKDIFAKNLAIFAAKVYFLHFRLSYPASPTFMSKVARFFLVHVTEIGKMYQMNTICFKWS